MKYLALIALIITSLASAESLRILSWNIYMIPKPILWTGQMDRAEEIATQLAAENYDVIFFQEAFSAGARKKIWSKLQGKYDYETGTFKKKKFLTILNSGLWAVSKYPMTVLDHVYFEQCAHADCYATKGSLMVEVELPHRKVQILGMHTQAWPGEKEDKIRYSQLGQVRAMMDEFREDHVDQIVVGDLNFDDYQPGYGLAVNSLLGTFGAELTGPIRFSSGELTNSHRKEKDRQELLDYVLLRNDSSTGAKIKNKMLRKRVLVKKGKSIDLSDHYGIEAEIEFPESQVPFISKGN